MQETVVRLMRSVYQKVKAMIHFIARLYLTDIVYVPFLFRYVYCLIPNYNIND